MEKMKVRIETVCKMKLKLLLCGLLPMVLARPASAATIDWKGTTSTDWGTGSNWSTGTVPQPGDAVQIGVVSFTNEPTLKSGATTTIASLTFGLTSTVILTINTGYTLAVTGAITQNQNTNNYGTFTTTIAGGGTLTGTSLAVGSAGSFPPLFANNLLEVISTISTFHISGNVVVNSTNYGVLFLGMGYNNATLSLEGGTMTIDGSILTANTSSGILPLTTATPKFSIDIPSGSSLNPVLKLTNAAAINTSSVAGTIDFYNNTGGTGTSTVYYSGSSQEVYTNTTAALDNTPQTYQYLQLTGSGTATADGGTLSVGANLTSTATAVAFNSNNPTVTIGGNWTNSSNVAQGSGNITVTGSVTNNSGGTLNLGTGNLYIGTNYTNNAGGIYSQSSGTTYFNGSSAQALVDNSTTGTTFKLVAFNGGGTSTMSAGTNNVNFAVASTGILTMSNSSKLVAGSASAAYLTLKSDTNGTATVAAIPSGCSITGFVTAQRFVQGSATYDNVVKRWVARNYRLMSSQVNEGADVSGNYPCSINYLGASTIISDCTSTYATRGGNPSLYLFDENYTPNSAGFTTGNFIGVTNITSTSANGTITTTDATHGTAKIYVGDGYMIYFRGDNVTHLTGSPNKTTSPYVAPESVTFSATGNLNQGSYSVVSWFETAGLIYTTSNAGNTPIRGFNLVGNPYPSSIDWSTFSSSNSGAAIYGKNVNPTVYIFNPTTSHYDTYNATTGLATGSAGKIIPSGQGFFVQANNLSPTLTFNENAKTNTQVTGSKLLMGTPAALTAYSSYLRLNLITDSINHSDMVVGFNSAATNAFNPVIDAEFFPSSGSPQAISAISSDGVKTSVKWVAFPGNTTTQIIKLAVSAQTAGQYTLQRMDFDAIPQIYDVWLMDNYKKDSLDLRNNTTYVFDISASDTASFGSNRFTIVLRQDPAKAVHLLSFSAIKVQSGSQIAWTTENEVNYTHFTVQRSTDGGINYSSVGSVASTGSGSYSLIDPYPLPGSDTYRLVIQDLNGVVSYSNTITLNYNNTSTESSNISIYPNPAISTVNLSIRQPNFNQKTLLAMHGQSVIQNLASTPALVSSNGSDGQRYNVTIIDVTGAVLRKYNSYSGDWKFNVENFPTGTYFIRVQDDATNNVVGSGTFIKL